MSIYNDNRKPYFYIIQHKDGMKYAGAKWGKDADPQKFMQRGGYCTGSKTVWQLLESDKVCFQVLEIIELDELNSIPFGCQEIDLYEKWFFQTIDDKDDWININFNAGFSYDSTNPELVARHLESTRSDTSKSKRTSTNLERYGVEFISQLDATKEKSKETQLKNFGTEYPMQNKELLYQTWATKLETLGFEQPFQNPEILKKAQGAIQEKYGVPTVLDLPEIRQKCRTSLEIKYGVDNPAKVDWYCGECDKSGRAIGNLHRWHKGHKFCELIIRGENIAYNGN